MTSSGHGKLAGLSINFSQIQAKFNEVVANLKWAKIYLSVSTSVQRNG